MRYLTMKRLEPKRLSALKPKGAQPIQVIKTHDRFIAAKSSSPDTRALMERVCRELRFEENSADHSEDHSRMTGEMHGEVVLTA